MGENFTREFAGEILIEKVNLERATRKESVIFKERLLNDVETGYKKIIVDFSNCSYMDSSIVGALVVLLKSLQTNEGKLIVVIPQKNSFQFLTGLNQMFTFSNNINEAILSLEQ